MKKTVRVAHCSMARAVLALTVASVTVGCSGGSGGNQAGSGGGTVAGSGGGTASGGQTTPPGSGGSGGQSSGMGSGGRTATGSGGTSASGSGGRGTVGSGGTSAPGSGGTPVSSGGSGGAPVGSGGRAGGSGGTGPTGTGGIGAGTGSGGATDPGTAPFTCPAGPFTGTIPNGSAAVQIADAPPLDDFNQQGALYTNCEGPVWVGGALYFSEFKGTPNPPPSRILKIDAQDKVSIAFSSVTDTGSNGLAVDGHGNLIAASHGVGGLVQFTLPGGTMTTLVASFNGQRFDSPNDLTITADGSIYFTDPNFQAGYPLPQANTSVYRLPPGGGAVTEVITTLNNPNGITLAPDQKSLYVSHTTGVYKYPINADGSVQVDAATHVDPTDLDGNAGDGMAIDCAGNLYVTRATQHDIIVVSSANTKVAQMTIPGAGQLTNIAFGGEDHKTLYVTSMGLSTFGGGHVGPGGTGAGGASGNTNPGRGVFKLPGMPIPGMPY